MNLGTKMQWQEERFNLPVIAHFPKQDIRFNSIIEASKITGINYHLIFESAIGKIKSTIKWEYEDGAKTLKYTSFYIRPQRKYTKSVPFTNGPPCG